MIYLIRSKSKGELSSSLSCAEMEDACSRLIEIGMGELWEFLVKITSWTYYACFLQLEPIKFWCTDSRK